MDDMFSRRDADYKQETLKGYTVLTDFHNRGAFLYEDIDRILDEMWHGTLPQNFRGLITLDTQGVYDGIQVTEQALFHNFVSLSCIHIEDAIKVASGLPWVINTHIKSNYMTLPK
jgi:hypothetical protein